MNIKHIKGKFKLLVIVLSIFVGYFSLAKVSDYLEYADIPDTDKIYYNGQFTATETYEVYIDTGSIYYITGNDNKIYNCFKILGTGYTDKLGEVYFQYEGKGSYICNDNKLRGLFKVDAGGWGELEDKDLSDGEDWKNYLDKIDTNGYYYHNGNGNDTGTGKARIDGVGFSIWNTVKTKLNLQQVFNNISITPQIIGTPIADGNDSADIRILIKYNGQVLKNFSVDSVFFSVGTDTDVIKNNSNTIAGIKYNGSLKTDENGYLTGTITSLIGGNNLTYKVGVQVGDNVVYGNGVASFKYPFKINLNLTGNEENNKILVGYLNKAKLTSNITSSNISNISFSSTSTKLKLISGDYFSVVSGDNIKIDNNYYDFQVNYSKFYPEDIAKTYYFISGDYTITINGDNYKIKGFNLNSSQANIYKDGKINSIKIEKLDTNKFANGKDILWYKIYFKDRHGLAINYMSFDNNFKDIDKVFNLNYTSNYRTGFFITGDNSSANIDGGYKIGVVSYKPVSNSILKGYLTNIKFNGNYNINNSDETILLNKLSFLNMANLTLEDKELKVNEAVNLNVSYNSSYNLSNPEYKLTGYIIDCNSCNWVSGEVLYNNALEDKSFDIYITGSIAPDSIIYSGYYSYDLNGDYGNKKVYLKKIKKYSPIIIIKGGDLGIKGIAASKINLIGGISYIATNKYILKYKNKLRKKILEKFIRGHDSLNPPSEINLSDFTKNTTKYYKCNNNEIIKIYGDYSYKIKIYFLGCNLNIIGNIRKVGKNSSLDLVLFQKNARIPNINNGEGWKENGANVYIKNNVDTIFANILTDGSIITYIGNNINEDNIFYENREGLADNKRQLYINGKLYSKNTIGGGLQDSNNYFTFLGGKKVLSSESIYGINSHIVTKAYDIKFFRAKLYDSNGLYDTGNLSKIILNKYNCSGNKDNDSKAECYMSLIIEDSNKKFDK